MNNVLFPWLVPVVSFSPSCAACVGCAAGSTWLTPRAAWGGGPTVGKPKVRLVFCETTNDKPIWPNIGYDFDARRNRLMECLTSGLPGHQFLPVQITDDPKQLPSCCRQTPTCRATWSASRDWVGATISSSVRTGKPTLLVDNLFGGSGLFLTRLPQIMAAGKPVDWVSSAQGRGRGCLGAEVRVAASPVRPRRPSRPHSARRGGRHVVGDGWDCKPDAVATPNFDQALQQLRQTKLLVVGGGWGGDPFRKASGGLGVEFAGDCLRRAVRGLRAGGCRNQCVLRGPLDAAGPEVVEPSREENLRTRLPCTWPWGAAGRARCTGASASTAWRLLRRPPEGLSRAWASASSMTTAWSAGARRIRCRP